MDGGDGGREGGYLVYRRWDDFYPKYMQGLIDPRSGERACNFAYACRDGEVLVVTQNGTLPFSKACPNPLKNEPKTFS